MTKTLNLKRLLGALALPMLATQAMAAGPKLLISEALINPTGTDSPYEWIELIATDTIDFAATPYSLVAANNGAATAAGWVAGGTITYGFSLTSGVLHAGDVAYVGGSLMAPTGTKLRTINTGTTVGDRFGSAQTSGVLGNGGSNADGIAVFDQSINDLTNASTPIDAVFYGTGMGTAVVAGGTAGYRLPVNDIYNGGLLQASSFVAGDPVANVLHAAGAFNATTGTFTTARTWSAATFSNDNLSAITVTSSVPEPQTLALMLAGLVGLGNVAQRRNRRG
jgi:hypothetical protein